MRPCDFPNSIPTPPASPSQQPHDALESTLDALVAFYHHERMWVHRTRALLVVDTKLQCMRGSSLRLEGIRPAQDAKEHILRLFDEMMGDRIESCQRINQLVRSARLANHT